MKDAIDLDLYQKIRDHRDAKRAAGKYRCTYTRTKVVFTGEIDENTAELGEGDWICQECGEVLAERRND